MGLVSALDSERQREEEMLKGMPPDQREEFKRLLRQGLWEQDKRLRDEYGKRKLIMLSEIQEVMQGLRDAEVVDATEEEFQKFRNDVSLLTKLLREESPAFAGHLAYQVKRRGKPAGARGGMGRKKHMHDLKSNEEKVRLVQEAMKRARDIAEAEAAQLAVWQQVQDRDALRQDILNKARDRKKRLEEELKVTDPPPKKRFPFPADPTRKVICWWQAANNGRGLEGEGERNGCVHGGWRPAYMQGAGG